MIYREMVQCTPEWFEIRRGKATSSRVSDVMATLKSGGEAASRRNYRAELVCEILTGVTPEGYVSKEMQWGTDNEPFARAAFELAEDVSVESIGFATHPQIERFGASCDGLVGNDGVLELKCPNTATHLDYLLRGKAPVEYELQMLSEIACTEREWVQFASFDPRLPKDLQLFKAPKFYRDEARIAEIEKMIEIFLSEVDAVIGQLQKLRKG